MRHALAIVTYVAADAVPETCRRLPETLRTLQQSGYPGRVVIVDDGSQHLGHHKYLDSLVGSYELIRRAANGGISRAKNTCIRALLAAGVDVGFIAEDDVEFRAGWWQHYLDAHVRTGIQHFSWAQDRDPGGMVKRQRIVQDHAIARTSRLNGVLLTFTPQVVETVGGFRVLPEKWGHEHTHWTRRIVAAGLAPYFCDVAASNAYVRLNRFAGVSSVTADVKCRGERVNLAPAEDLSRIHWPIQE